MKIIECPGCNTEIKIKDSVKSVTCSKCGQEIAIVKTEEELGEALKEEPDTIEVEGDLKNKVFRIKATGKVAWAIAIASIGIAVAILMSTGGVGAPVSSFIGAGAVSILGLPTAISAVSIAVAGGGVGALNTLRKYEITESRGNKLVLRRK